MYSLRTIKTYFKTVLSFAAVSAPCRSLVLYRFFASHDHFSLYFIPWINRHYHTDNDFSEESLDSLEDTEYQKLLDQLCGHHGLGHAIFVVQPKIKWGPKVNKLTKPEHQLAEAVTLTKTLPYWRVVGQSIVPVKNFETKTIFGTGNLEILKNQTRKTLATAIFVSVNMLSGLQHSTLEDEFQMPVFDRYNIVLRIFSDHASTKEAKLQIALAEIPFLRSRLNKVFEGSDRNSRKTEFIGAIGGSYQEKKKMILRDRELKLKSYLNKVKERRNLLRLKRRRLELPTVAVIGYTNAGKTALIKSLTEDRSLIPKNQLFATLDVTAHAGKLPSYQKVIFMDTVGFISDIPTALVQSFAATLEDVSLSDLIVHVRDLHHPDKAGQKETVLKTLRELNLPQKLMDTLIEVGNKVDLLESVPGENEGCYYISATSGQGVADLRHEIESRLMKNVGLINSTVRIPMGGPQLSWLYKFGAVKSAWADPNDSQFLMADVLLSPTNHAKFVYNYGNCFVK